MYSQIKLEIDHFNAGWELILDISNTNVLGNHIFD